MNHKNEEFMKNYDTREELAPRDIVSRSIDEEMKKTGKDCVYLDISHKERDQIKKWTLRKCPLAQERTKNSKKLQINYPRPL